ncbi:uncharacterized protein C8R40DRAFT_736426 [Lentinula edodes]|uniref:uncharacterized protein n=1 Tax=Lentinula edodes TaxID=5353 RepID=UPI001E8DFA9D|nr:uncharacterized protein C8R40DRAFT_736426 [Lentinula edodes]KAH7869497.1 hypothetical protein C8R40DRAFT_736426 [Lentinula edodes]
MNQRILRLSCRLHVKTASYHIRQINQNCTLRHEPEILGKPWKSITRKHSKNTSLECSLIFLVTEAGTWWLGLDTSYCLLSSFVFWFTFTYSLLRSALVYVSRL